MIFPCRNWPPQCSIFKGHTDGVSGFSLWGQDVITISKNRIGLTSLSKAADEVCKQLYILSSQNVYYEHIISMTIICMLFACRMCNRLVGPLLPEEKGLSIINFLPLLLLTHFLHHRVLLRTLNMSGIGVNSL
jgi:hypothetical protein